MRWLSKFVVCLTCFAVPANAVLAAEPTPIEDDATLYDVQFVGSKLGWTVGDHGVIWKTIDGGQTWKLQSSHVESQLRKSCFLTDRVGWIVGGETIPHVRIGRGIVLFTSDGGETWQQLARNQLPQLHYVKFFDLARGIAVGESSAEHPTGIFVTNDGGNSWKNLGSRPSAGWRTAAFPRDGIGVVAGLRGQVRTVAGQGVLPPRFTDFGLRGLRGLKLNADGTGWLVGDGGLVRSTTNGGIVWGAPLRPLPKEVDDVVDFRAVESLGESVWIAGEPGSVIWHSPDAGRSWNRQFTNQPQPIHAVAFSSKSIGCAVGAFGTVLRTADGGQTWIPIRGAGRRAAFVCFLSRTQQLPLATLAKFSGDLAYRSIALMIPRYDVGPDGESNRDLDIVLDESVTHVGGSGARVGWQLPLLLPNLDRNRDRLIAEWNQQTEGKLEDVVLGKLVRQLRTWRPDVVIINEPNHNDAASRLLNQAVSRAVQLAGDPTHSIEQYELAGLNPWQVKQVFLRLSAGSGGDVNVESNELLPRLGQTVRAAASDAVAILSIDDTTFPKRDSYQLFDRNSGDIRQVAVTGLFSGIGLAPGSAARRALRTIDDDELQRQIAIGKRQRNFHAYMERLTNDSRGGSQLLGEMNSVTAGMSRTQAVRQFVDLFERYRIEKNYELATSVCLELARQFPDQPATHDATRWLVQQWCSEEATWQRMRTTGTRSTKTSVDSASVVQEFQNAIRDKNDDRIDPGKLLNSVGRNGKLSLGDNSEWVAATMDHQQRQAIRLAGLLRQRSPQLFRRPKLAFPLASVLRRRRNHSMSDSIYRRFQTRADSAWQQAAAVELWFVNPVGIPVKPIQVCRPTTERPRLDAMLSDACWQQAEEIRLRSPDSASRTYPDSILFLSYDSEFLYVAVSAPRVAGLNYAETTTSGRRHDADLSDFDRLTIYLDLDRDYSTSYAIHIDQRGEAAESCVGDESWDPEIYIAADLDATHWRIEAAIRLKDLAAQSPRANNVWAVGFVRTMPAFGFQSWTGHAGSRPVPQTFGLVKFD